jgi:2-phospho-L-lactate guanylyltransferase (CobY/MobA/RfbA family)
MKLNEKQQEVRKNISKLNNAITEAIDKICEENDYKITYAEINSALTDTLKSNLGYELREMWKKEGE